MNKISNESFGCFFSIIFPFCFVIPICFHKEIFNFIKHHIPLTVNIILIIILIIISVKLYLSEKNFSEHLKNENKYDYYKYELESYKKAHPAWMPKEIDTLKKEKKQLKSECKQLNEKLQSISKKYNNLNEMMYTAHIDKIIHLYHVPVEYKNVKKNENESKADFFNEQYPIGKNSSCPLGYADINVLCFKSANKQTNIVYIINSLFFDKERTQFVFFDKYNLENPNVVCNFLTPNKFSYVISNDFKKFIVRFTTLTLKLDLNNYRDKRNLLNQYSHTKSTQ